MIRITRSPLLFHPSVASILSPSRVTACQGEPVMLPAGQHVRVAAEVNGRILLRGKMGFVWALLRDLIPLDRDT